MSDKLKINRARIEEIDGCIAALFEKRMEAVKQIAEYKRENSLPTLDKGREEELIKKNSALIGNEEVRDLYVDMLKSTMEISKRYQRRILAKDGVIVADHSEGGYPIFLGRGALRELSELLRPYSKVAVLTDSGVPAAYAEAVMGMAKESRLITVQMGEGSKSFSTLEAVLSEMSDFGISRADALVAVGGGMVSDLGGLAAALYMRGIHFYSCTTTLLGAADASVGGKTAVNLLGAKNLAGVFSDPQAVVIDTDCFKTLTGRQIAEGLAEIIKIAAVLDKELFERLEGLNPECVLEEIEPILRRTIELKLGVVSKDRREGDLRRVLNFGHTVGHAIESCSGELYHGECVGLGMLCTSFGEARERIYALLEKFHLPTTCKLPPEQVAIKIGRDKKRECDTVCVITCKEIGEYEIEPMPLADAEALYLRVFDNN